MQLFFISVGPAVVSNSNGRGLGESGEGAQERARARGVQKGEKIYLFGIKKILYLIQHHFSSFKV